MNSGALARPQALGRRLADDERRGQRVGEVRVRRGVAERRRHDDAEDRHDHHDQHAGQDLPAAERPDQAVARSRLWLNAGPLGGHAAQIAVMNVKYRGSSAQQSRTIATPIPATSRPPISDTVRPWRTSGRSRPGARS